MRVEQLLAARRLLVVGELLGGDEAGDAVVLGRRLEILADGEKIDTRRAQIVHHLGDLVTGSVLFRETMAPNLRVPRVFVSSATGEGLPELRLGGTDCRCFGPASKSGFAWQLRAGLEYRLSPVQAVSLQYTWLALPAPDQSYHVPIRGDVFRFGVCAADEGPDRG